MTCRLAYWKATRQAFALVARNIRPVRSFFTLVILGLTACHGRSVEAIDYRAISAVEADIKRQIGVYMAAATHPATMRDVNGDVVTLPTDQASFACGAGRIGFDVLSVKADLLTTRETDLDGKLSASIPVHAVTVGPSGELSSGRSITQELVYNLWFDPLRDQQGKAFLNQSISEDTLRDAPIASILLDLKNSLIASGMKVDPYTHLPRDPMPCHWNWNIDPKKPGGDPGDTVKMGVTVTRDAKAGLDLKVSVVDIGLSSEWKSTTGNTITVSFYQAGTLDVEPDKDQKGSAPAKSEPIHPSKRPARPAKSAYIERDEIFQVFVQSAMSIQIAALIDNQQNPASFGVNSADECAQICQEKGENSVSCIKCKHIGEDMVPLLEREDRQNR
jgi:hypothetical protein